MTTSVRHQTREALRLACAQFAADVRYYLTQDPRQLPSRYLYDDLGSALFEAISYLPWYPLKRAELRLLRTHAHDILHGSISTIIELGSGSGEKLSALIAAAGLRRDTLTLHLVDVSPSALADAERRLAAFEAVRVCPHQTTYENGLEEVAAEPRDDGRALALFLGSNIGNFDPPGRDAFLREVRRSLRPRDRLLLGADLVKPEAQMRLAYDDPLGVTAAFNRNLLVRLNRELEADLDLDGFAHRVIWNGGESRIEMHLVSRGAQRVRIDAAGVDIQMNDGESIWTESSYKFESAEVASMLGQCGFRVEAQWLDANDRFVLTCGEAV